MSDESSDEEESDDAAGVDPEGATVKSESEPGPKEAYRAVNSTRNSGLIKPRKMSNQNLFIADTGAMCHIKVDSTGLTNLQKVSKTVRMGQLSVKILFQGDYKCEAHQTDGTVKKVVLKDVRVVPGAGCNLLSLTRLLNNGYDLKGNQKGLTAVRGKTKIMFDQTIQAGSGYLLGIRLVPTSTSKVASLTLPEGSRVQYEAFHAMLGHPDVSSVQRTAKYLILGLSNPTDQCPKCATAKMRQKNIPKENTNQSTIPGK